ncbi:MAG: ribosome biogenesis GTP-binding protein YihA/YsxC [Geminicoccaceae bacterium]
MAHHAPPRREGQLSEPSPEALEAGRLLFARPATFLRGVAELGQLPPVGLPEVAMAGRSNVGKSSLINALTGRSALARTSNTPGRTQEINLFDLAGRLILADLPGYGYAQAPKAKVDAWTKLVFAYLRGRPSLRRVCVLVDSRHGLKSSDEEAMALLAQAAVPFQLVLTKADLVRPTALGQLQGELEAKLRRTVAAVPEIVVTSSKKNEGIDRLRAALAELAAPLAQETSA